jgi:ubiquinone/menaquinone biosynthesis C-methylase UbiE
MIEFCIPMNIWIMIGILAALLIIVLIIVSVPRRNIARKACFEGIEDDETIRAYDTISRWPQFKLIRWFVVNELKRYQPQGILADIGCGPGYLIANIAKALPHLSLIGVDISEDMVKKASQNLTSLVISEKVSFRQGDIQALPFESGSLDFIVSTLSLHHWSDPGQAIEQIERVLKPGGQFLIFDLRRDSRKIVYSIITFAQTFIIPPVMKRANEPTNSFLASYTPDEMGCILSGTRFKRWEIKGGIGWLFIWGKKS